ncbi:RNA polymerase subunit sigma-70 [Mycobacterium sp. E740]|nr:RNA polymerase subunit sigma-70 [Mycobacterium sp. E740]
MAPTDADRGLADRFARDAVPLVGVLSRRARRLTTCDADAEDLVQDTLLHAYAGFASFEPGTNLKAWLLRIMHNRWVSGHRYRQRRPNEVAEDVAGVADLARASMRHRSAEAQVLDTMASDDLHAALASLPHGTRMALYYADVLGHTYAETAALLDIPAGTVMSRVFRGRQRLRAELAHLAPTERNAVTA